MTTTQDTAALLTPEMREKYDRDGYLVFDPGIPMADIDAVVDDLAPRYKFGDEAGAWTDDQGVFHRSGPKPSLMNAWRVVDSIKTLALAPKVLALIEELYGRKPLPFQTINFPIATEQMPHADAIHFNSEPPGFMCGVWIALEDMDMSNGTLQYYPGSQKLPEPTPDYVGLPPDPGAFPDYGSFMNARHKHYEQFVQAEIKRNDLQPEFALIKKGQALVWSSRLIHGGSPHRDKDRTRNSQVTHYFFEGCRFFSPVRTEGDHIFWDSPAWIRWNPPEVVTPALLNEAIADVVPADANVLVANRGSQELLQLGERDARHFPQAEDGSYRDYEELEDASAELERLRAEGARYIVFPAGELWFLQNKEPELHGLLENRYRPVMRDGCVAVVYELEPA
jgi:Phytanoyl-CoA dioxygenase (PhyH)